MFDKVAHKSNGKTLLEEVKFYLYYIDGLGKVLAACIDQDTELRSAGKKLSNIIYSSSTEGSYCQGGGCNHNHEDYDENNVYSAATDSYQTAPSKNYDPMGNRARGAYNRSRGGNNNRSNLADCPGKCGEKHPGGSLQYCQTFKAKYPADRAAFVKVSRICMI